MLWSLNHVLKATVRGARDSRVTLLIGLAGTKLDRRRPRRPPRSSPAPSQRGQRRTNIFIRSGRARGRMNTLMCQTLGEASRVAYGCAADRRPCELIVRDAYHRVLEHELIGRQAG
jgi:hypothetical protein